MDRKFIFAVALLGLLNLSTVAISEEMAAEETHDMMVEGEAMMDETMMEDMGEVMMDEEMMNAEMTDEDMIDEMPADAGVVESVE